MKVIEYIFYCNFFNLFALLLLTIFIFIGNNFSAKLNRYFLSSIALIALLIVCDSVNNYYRAFNEPFYIRTVFSTFGYIIRPFCAAIFLKMSAKDTRKNNIMIWSVLLANSFIVIYNLWFPVVFYYDELNQFHRAFFWYIPYISSIILLGALIISASVNFSLNRKKAVFIYAITLAVILGVYAEAVDLARFTLPTAGIISVIFHYLYTNNDLYKRDTLTQLYNRRCFEADCKKFVHKKNLVVATMDLNDLKKLNDTFGHSEGDNALLTTVTGMKKFFEKIGILYRTGGDEFMAVFPDKKIEDLQNQINGFKKYISETKYQVAAGFAEFKKGSNLNDAINLSDQRMYENKKQIKSEL